ncbi:exosome complex component RRP45B-like isoform X1 [Phalaenopsis equestris]|uniref:exosome complex component RRP45B-like isoform X1 n=1 Tax=Phalaenopsis equestris TaxID=78828 RepID=UPI0009E51B3A|nr:exosome complex component RRP45B-like isoform X1 [Phalaenopsis equestris]
MKVIDPTHKEEAIMGGRMTTTLNSNGDVCVVQKAGGDSVSANVITHCLRLAASKTGEITDKIINAVDSYNIARALRKAKRHTSLVASDISVPDIKLKKSKRNKKISLIQKMIAFQKELLYLTKKTSTSSESILIHLLAALQIDQLP